MNTFFCLTWRNPSEKFFCYPSSSLPSLLPSSPVSLSFVQSTSSNTHSVLKWRFLRVFFLPWSNEGGRLKLSWIQQWNNSKWFQSLYQIHSNETLKVSKSEALEHKSLSLLVSILPLFFPFLSIFCYILSFVALHHYFHHYNIVTVCFIFFSPCYCSYFCIVRIKILLKMQNFVFSSNPRITFVMIYFLCFLALYQFFFLPING